ncbi:hypothetical protein CWE04_11205 [Thomasclavelia cocleata]|uniref:hypothetical protein n=1 Tax=Thomasclavelia cocleata TaxID=69824 RepID=UPI000B85FEB5|nr:hypothetical protein [Thomasclavelia cocleata]MCR1959905.1 hypothetical protein [Thomasclavelia cocleata]NDO41749.1 hypothetical protein [Thomasclavelia cocleata]PJN79779.1 hypothetical protein CWE04_11205 [Thomasclavelia cocleata]
MEIAINLLNFLTEDNNFTGDITETVKCGNKSAIRYLRKEYDETNNNINSNLIAVPLKVIYEC